MTSQGKTLRVRADTINQQGTGSKGIKVVKISEPDFLVGVDKVSADDEKKSDKSGKTEEEAENSSENEQ